MAKITFHDLDDDNDFIAPEQRSSKKVRFKETDFRQRNRQHRNKFHRQQTGLSRVDFHDLLRIGSIIPCNFHHIQEGYQGKTHSARPVLVYALWRDEAKNIKKIEAINLTTNRDKIFPCDLDITGDLTSQFQTRKDAVLKTNTILCADNIEKYFPTERPIQMPSFLWPDILVRRAQGLLFSPVSEFVFNGTNEGGLTREGMTFNTLDMENVRSGRWAPDVPGGDFGRQDFHAITQDTINAVADYACAYTFSPKGANTAQLCFPPMKEWNDIPEVPMPVWGKTGNILARFHQDTVRAAWSHAAKPMIVPADQIRSGRFSSWGDEGQEPQTFSP